MILSEVIMYKVINYQQICNLELFWQMKYSVYQKNTCKLCHNLGNISVALLIMNFKECFTQTFIRHSKTKCVFI